MIKLLDLSHHNIVTNWDKIKDPVILKCTEGLDYEDQTFRERSKRPNFYGSYHFFRDVDIEKQVDFYLKTLGDAGGIMVLDFEIECPDAQNKCKKFLDLIEVKTGKIPYLYTNEVRANKIDIPFPYWIARYGTNNGTPQKPPTKPWSIWQYTSKGKVDGIKGFVDMNLTLESSIEPNLPSSETLTPNNDNMTFKPGKFIKLSQRDPKWSFKTIGNSNSTIGMYGCTITCISMASSWFNCFQDPSWMAKNLRFLNDLVLWKSIDEKTCFDFEWRFYKYDALRISDGINSVNKICLLNVYNRHWVVALKKVPLGYWVADPWSGIGKFYLTSSISGGAILKI
jgi:lysozyme